MQRLAGVRVVNRLFGTEPVILHASGPLKLSPLWTDLERALFAEEPSSGARSRPDYTFFIWNSGARRSHDKAKRMATAERCLRRLTVPHYVLGRGIDPWKNILKIPTLRDALHKVTTPYVIATDSPDVLILRDPGQSIELFEQFGAELVYIADSSFWPPEFKDVKLEEERVPGARSTRFPYLNSGALIGRTEYCRDFFDEAARHAELRTGIPYVEGTSGAGTAADDQSIMKRLYLANYPHVQLDFRCQLFQTLTYQKEDVLRLMNGAGSSRRWRRF